MNNKIKFISKLLSSKQDFKDHPFINFETRSVIKKEYTGESEQDRKARLKKRKIEIKQNKENEIMKIVKDILISKGEYLRFKNLDFNDGNSTPDFKIKFNGRTGICELREVVPYGKNNNQILRSEHPLFRKHPTLIQDFDVSDINDKQLVENILKGIKDKEDKEYLDNEDGVKILILAHVKHTSNLDSEVGKQLLQSNNMYSNWKENLLTFNGPIYKNIDWNILSSNKYDIVMFLNCFFFDSNVNSKVESINHLIYKIN